MIRNPNYFEDKHPYKMMPIVSDIIYYAVYKRYCTVFLYIVSVLASDAVDGAANLPQ